MLNDKQVERYARHLILPEMDDAGQEAFGRASMLVVGVGALGSALTPWLAAAGVGRLILVDDDHIDLSNLQRQTLYTTADVGSPKVVTAARHLTALNTDVTIETHATRFDAGNAEWLINEADVIADGSDNAATRLLIADTAARLHKPLVSAAITRFDGQMTTLVPWKDNSFPCYRCLFPDLTTPESQSCADVGVFNALAGVMGAMQAAEMMKIMLGKASLEGVLLLINLWDLQLQKIKTPRDPDCCFCNAF